MNILNTHNDQTVYVISNYDIENMRTSGYELITKELYAR